MTHHRRGLRRLLQDDALALRIEADFETVGLSANRIADGLGIPLEAWIAEE